MAAVEVTISGILYDKHRRTVQHVVIFGEASLTGVGVGGGPIVPPPTDPSDPVHIWGGGNVPMPSPPIANVPGAPGYQPPITPVPPNVEVPPPGSPPVVLPGSTPTHPIQPPAAIVVDYPGVGKVLVPMPATSEPK